VIWGRSNDKNKFSPKKWRKTDDVYLITANYTEKYDNAIGVSRKTPFLQKIAEKRLTP
jgi:hypothetical protein